MTKLIDLCIQLYVPEFLEYMLGTTSTTPRLCGAALLTQMSGVSLRRSQMEQNMIKVICLSLGNTEVTARLPTNVSPFVSLCMLSTGTEENSDLLLTYIVKKRRGTIESIVLFHKCVSCS